MTKHYVAGMEAQAMTGEQAISMVRKYACFAREQNLPPIIAEIDERWRGGSASKAMRWLGFCQGWLVAMGVFTLEQVKIHSQYPEREL